MPGQGIIDLDAKVPDGAFDLTRAGAAKIPTAISSTPVGGFHLCRFAKEQGDFLPWFRKHHTCPCGTIWWDEWDCLCNDRCPTCDAEIELDEHEAIQGAKSGSLPDRPYFWGASTGRALPLVRSKGLTNSA